MSASTNPAGQVKNLEALQQALIVLQSKTAPVYVGVTAFIDGLLFAFGTDLAFDTIYPHPAIRPS